MAEKIKFATIFDMDGVLIDTHDLFLRAQENILGQYGIPSSQEDIKKYLEKPLSDNLIDWRKEYNLFMKEETYRELYRAEEIRLLKEQGPDSQLVNLLEDLDKHCVMKGIGTVSKRERAKCLLKSACLRKYFPVLVAEEDVRLHKPASDVFLEVANRLAVLPGQCIVFEDSSNGVLAGLNGNMKVIGYKNNHNSLEDLKGCDLIIKSFSEVNYNTLENMFE